MPLPRSRSETKELLGKTFDQLPNDWKQDMKSVRPAKGEAFTPEQQAMLKGFYLVLTPAIVAQLEQLQAGKTIRVEPITLPDGRLAIAADVLTDMLQQGDNFKHLENLVPNSGVFVEVPDSAWPAPQMVQAVSATTTEAATVVKKIL